MKRRPLDDSPYLSDRSIRRDKVAPNNDFINLANVLCFGFPEAFKDCKFDETYADFKFKLECAAEDADESDEVWRDDRVQLRQALRHHKHICETYDCPDDTTLRMFKPSMPRW